MYKSTGSKALYANRVGNKLLLILMLGFSISFAAPTLVYPIDWPAQALTVTTNFGWNDQGKPTLGTSFESEGPVHAADRGELIFSHYGSDTASRLPSPLGAWVALDHGEGLISIYSRLEDTKLQELPQVLEKGTVLGVAGRSGWSTRRGFHFSLFDRKERCWVNPSMIITPLPDTRAPTIQSVVLRNAEGRIIEPNQISSISQGKYTVCVSATDTRIGPNENALAPHRILCTVNGSEIGALTFETYSARDGILIVYRNGLVPVKQVYAPAPGFEVGEVWVTRGQVSLEIIAQDIIGNAQSAVYRLTVE
ncbi:MAG: M23 family metallopeptidase [Treponema sp.]|jgi:murein DD-endopeptidase MepM/ murein hydrolase activator NlpD|nr:M23 family metallopeptidase [Treponema sp.]